MKFRKRMMSFLLAAAIAAGSFMAAPMQADAAPAKGIDVAVYQGAIDWNAVKNAGYSFAFVKVGSGKSGLDPYFAANMVGANAAGLKVGAYVYSYSTTVEGIQQEALFAIAALEPFTVSLPVVLDLEEAAHKTLTKEQMGALITTFCETVKSAGYYPMIYSNKNMLVNQIGATPYDVWVAQYSDQCDYANPAFWQFTSSGSVPGIAGNVDLNYQFKDYSNLIVANGFVDRNGKRYYYKNYRMQFGFVQDNGRTYFMNADGSMYKNGWIGDGTNMYYMSTKDGHMLHDLVNIQGKNYYFGADGLMQRGLVAIDGKIYLFGTDGTMQYNAWYTDAAGMRYFAEDGSMVAGTVKTIDGVAYTFDANGIAAAVPVAAPSATADAAAAAPVTAADVTAAIAAGTINPLAWVIDPVTGITVDSTTGQVVDPVIVEQTLNLARQMAAQQ